MSRGDEHHHTRAHDSVRTRPPQRGGTTHPKPRRVCTRVNAGSAQTIISPVSQPVTNTSSHASMLEMALSWAGVVDSTAMGDVRVLTVTMPPDEVPANNP